MLSNGRAFSSGSSSADEYFWPITRPQAAADVQTKVMASLFAWLVTCEGFDTGSLEESRRGISSVVIVIIDNFLLRGRIPPDADTYIGRHGDAKPLLPHLDPSIFFSNGSLFADVAACGSYLK